MKSIGLIFIMISSMTQLSFSMESQGRLAGLTKLIGAVSQSQPFSANVLIQNVPDYIEQAKEEPSFLMDFAELVGQMVLLKKDEQLSKNNEVVLSDLIQKSYDYVTLSFSLMSKHNNGSQCLQGLSKLITTISQFKKIKPDVADKALSELILDSKNQVDRVFWHKKQKEKE